MEPGIWISWQRMNATVDIYAWAANFTLVKISFYPSLIRMYRLLIIPCIRSWLYGFKLNLSVHWRLIQATSWAMLSSERKEFKRAERESELFCSSNYGDTWLAKRVRLLLLEAVDVCDSVFSRFSRSLCMLFRHGRWKRSALHILCRKKRRIE